jgi:hypothetical protein
MNAIFFLIFSVNLINVATAFKATRPFGLRAAPVLLANKLDGVMIPGDLTPLANNLLIKVKEALSSTSG